MAFGDYIKGLTAVGISAAAAVLSSTIIKSELLPEQLAWLGTAGTVVAACMIAVSFASRRQLQSRIVKIVLASAVLLTCACLIWLRSARVSEVELGGAPHNYLRGQVLAQAGLDAQVKCNSDSIEQLIQCAGVSAIPKLYGGSYWFAYYSYVFDYLLLLACFIAFISAIGFKTPQ
jgi:hypothetical protein